MIQEGRILVFSETVLKGAYVIELERHQDFRGFFARTFCRREFAEHGLEPAIEQSSISFNPRKGTLRGMHYQAAPFEEVKVVRCTMGRIHDVIIDLRPESPTYRLHLAIELSAENRKMLYIPWGFAHGFQTLEDNAEVHLPDVGFFRSRARPWRALERSRVRNRLAAGRAHHSRARPKLPGFSRLRRFSV